MRANDDLIEKTDALIRRHRSFIARPAPPPSAQSASAPEETIPVLTEVVSNADEHLEDPLARLAALQGELQAAFTAWLDEALPAALNDISPQLCDLLADGARKTLLPQLLETLKHGNSREKL